MKKKILTLIVLMSMLIFTVSCGSNQSNETNNNGNNGQKTEKTKEKASKEIKKVKPDEILTVYTEPDEYKGYLITVSGRVFNTAKYKDGSYQFQILESNRANHNTAILTKDKVKEGEFIEATGIIEGVIDTENTVRQPIRMLGIVDAKVKEISPKDYVDQYLDEDE